MTSPKQLRSNQPTIPETLDSRSGTVRRSLTNKSAEVMRTTLLLSFLLLAGCQHDPRAHIRYEAASVKPQESLLIQPGAGIGKIRSGMTLEEVVASLGEPERRSTFTLEYLRFGFAVTASRDRLVRVVQCGAWCDTTSPLIKNFAGHTKEGIGMGSRREEIIKAFGEPSSVEGEELVYSKLGLTFLLADGKVHYIAVRFAERNSS